MTHLVYLRLLWRKRILLIACGPRPVRLSSKIRPQTLNALSEGALDAGMLRINRASFESAGKRSLLNFHHGRMLSGSGLSDSRVVRYSAISSSTVFCAEMQDVSSSQSANRSVCFLAGGGSSSVSGTRSNCILWIISFAPLDWIGMIVLLVD